MTRKDYVLIAAAVDRAAWTGDPNIGSDVENAAFIRGYKQALLAAAIKLANDMGAENAKFDRSRFLQACGVAS